MRILGGVREAFFSDNYYKLLWSKRVGFAKIALEAQVVRKSSVEQSKPIKRFRQNIGRKVKTNFAIQM